jgi:hypothetical protein
MTKTRYKKFKLVLRDLRKVRKQLASLADAEYSEYQRKFETEDS